MSIHIMVSSAYFLHLRSFILFRFINVLFNIVPIPRILMVEGQAFSELAAALHTDAESLLEQPLSIPTIMQAGAGTDVGEAVLCVKNLLADLTAAHNSDIIVYRLSCNTAEQCAEIGDGYAKFRCDSLELQFLSEV